ncbi:hypothetical protein PVMG_00005 [Plasmodium vivax Mauritania I]|uniref:Variable surface protein Vir7-like protein n=1 Tax=Plasmodium vivax Mauritania I TaxID=1035515 RepID=A0A0J9T812_PLAVI|nr:hypothetical protein PVMG_00005 [Plasmodium vivax Mauritania I]
MSHIIKLWNQYETVNVCDSSHFVSYIDKDEAKKAKRLFDYALNYERLHSLYGNDNFACTPGISQYIIKSKKLIQKIIAECPNDQTFKPYCAALNEIKNMYGIDNLLNLQCNRVEENDTPNREEEEEDSRSIGKSARHLDSHPVSAGDHAERGRGDTGSKSKDSGHSKTLEGYVDNLPGPPSELQGTTGYLTAHDTGTLYGDQTKDLLGETDVSPSPDTPKTTAIALPALSALSLGFMLFKVYINKILILIYYS